MRVTILLIILFVSFNCLLYSFIEETASLQDFIYGTTDATSYDDWKSHIVEGIADPGYNAYAEFDRQMNGFGTFTVPTEEDLTNWQTLGSLLVLGDLDLAESMIELYGYQFEVVLFHDTDTDRDYYMIREIPNDAFYDNNNTPGDFSDDEVGAFTTGWGLFIFNPDSTNPEIITMVHPNDDYPAIPLSVHAFQVLDARYLLMSGVGREVLWTEVDYYSNNKTLCDPSRIEDLPFNSVYQVFCDEIRETFGKREFSLQIHTYDWGTSHAGYSDVQISSGNNKKCPDLPIRDHSGQGKDMVNLGSDEIIPANYIGAHPAVYLNDYSTYYYHDYEFNYTNGDISYPVNNHVDLTGHPTNRQMVYTLSEQNQYDSFDPFFHVEMDELPNMFTQDLQTLKWFYGWDIVQENYIRSEYFTKAIPYYLAWIYRLKESLDYTLEMDDYQIPAIPQNFVVTGESYNNISFEWEKSDSYDFYTYEIRYATEPIGVNNYDTWSRSNTTRLACLAQTETTINYLDTNTQYYVQIRALDKNGNYSQPSEELIVYTGAGDVDNFTALPDYDFINLTCTCNPQLDNFAGINIYRKTGEEEYSLIAGHETDAGLVGDGGSSQSYIYADYDINNNTLYTYKIAVVSDTGSEFWDVGEQTTSLNTMKKLLFSRIDGFVSDEIYFSVNPSASDYIDDLDVVMGTNTLFCASMYQEDFTYPYTAAEYYEVDTKSMIDVNTQYKKWIIRFRTNNTAEIVKISLEDHIRDNERVYLEVNNMFINLAEDYYTFIPSGTGWMTMNLYWGNVVPSVNFNNQNNLVIQAGETQSFSWEYSFNQFIDHADLYLEDDNILLPIAMNLSCNITSFDWTVLPIISNDIHPVLKVTMNEGDQFIHSADQHFAIVGAEHFVQTNPGWELISHPYNNESNSIEDIYGATAELWYLESSNFINQTEMDSYYGYWIHSDIANYGVVQDAGINESEELHALNSGWNIFPNPSLIDYDINQMQFYFNGFHYEYFEAIQNNLIQPLVYGSDNALLATTEIKKGKSYYIYSYYDDITMKIAPFYEPNLSTNYPIDWSIALTATQAENNRTGVKVGAFQYATDDYDYLYDLFQPTLKPMADAVNMEIVNDFTDIDEPIQQKIDAWIELDGETDLEWDFILECNPEEPVIFQGFLINIPDSLNSYLLLNNEYYDLLEGEAVSFLSETEICDVKLILTHETLTSTEQVQVPFVFSASNYPNPFNPVTTIRFSIPNEEKVNITVYNVKGQKVKKLLNEPKEAGNHQVIWQGDDDFGKQVGSGVYFYKIQTKSRKTITRKMLLMK